jgi:hypothetical protein
VSECEHTESACRAQLLWHYAGSSWQAQSAKRPFDTWQHLANTGIPGSRGLIKTGLCQCSLLLLLRGPRIYPFGSPRVAER